MWIVDSCALPPGGCIISQRADGPLVDTGKELPYIGRIYLGHQVIYDAITMLGGLQPLEAEALRDEIADLKRQVADLEDELDDFDSLRTSVARTLKDGATVDRKGRLQLRGMSAADRKRLGVAADEEAV